MNDEATRSAENVRPGRRETVKAVLTADRTPMWFTLLALLAGAAGTYFVAPRINAEFETQKIKTDFVIRNFNDLRQKMEDFQGTFVIASQKVAAGQDARADVSRLQELAAKVGAQNISMMPMFTATNGPMATGDEYRHDSASYHPIMSSLMYLAILVV